MRLEDECFVCRPGHSCRVRIQQRERSAGPVLVTFEPLHVPDRLIDPDCFLELNPVSGFRCPASTGCTLDTVIENEIIVVADEGMSRVRLRELTCEIGG